MSVGRDQETAGGESGCTEGEETVAETARGDREDPTHNTETEGETQER